MVKLTKEQDDYIFSALAYMGNSSHQMSWANNCLEDILVVPENLKKEMIQINSKIHELQDKLREIRKEFKSAT